MYLHTPDSSPGEEAAGWEETRATKVTPESTTTALSGTIIHNIKKIS